MTRVCAGCRKIIGEKCPHCGAEAQPVSANAAGHAIEGTDFVCPECGRVFQQGEGGETHSLCGGCLQTERAKAVGR